MRREIDQIGYKFLDGTIKTGWFGTGFLRHSNPEQGVEIIRKVVLRNHAQGYDFLPDAQYRLAKYLFDHERYEEAQLEFEYLINSFKDSIWVTISEFLLGESFFLTNQGAAYDEGSLNNAQTHYEKFLELSGATATADPHVAKAHERLETIRNRKAEKEYLKGEFYFKNRKWRAAAEVLRPVPAKYPGTVWADKADKLLAKAQAKINEDR